MRIKGKSVKTCSRIAVMRSKDRLLKDVGLRSAKPELESERFKRTEIMRCHGTRKFFETNAFKAGMNLMYIRRLMGQMSDQLEEACLQIKEKELLEGDSRHVGFISVIDQLTISDENRLRKQVQTLKIEKSKMEKLEQKMDEYDQILAQFAKTKKAKEIVCSISGIYDLT
jgi:hypothetical protein